MSRAASPAQLWSLATAGVRWRRELARGYFSSSRDYPLSPLLALRSVFRPPFIRVAPRMIRAIREDDAHIIVSFKGIERELYWPKTLSILSLYQVIAESFDPTHDHYYEVPETAVRREDVVLDCGAAEGLFALRVAERAMRVIAFEPMPLFVDSLMKTFATSTNVDIEPVALGRERGLATLVGDSISSRIQRDGKGVPVPVTTIDDWVSERGLRVDYIKADLEGSELEVFEGAKATIRAFRPRIACTTYHPGQNWRQLLSLVRDLSPEYEYRAKGLSVRNGMTRPMMIHLWSKELS